MTAPLAPDAWAEARELVRQSLKGGAPGLTEATREAVVGSIMLKLTNKVLAPLLAALQQVMAERDEARRMHRWNIDRTGDGEVLVCRGYHDKGEDCDHERFVPEERPATATSELARLRAEGEALKADRDDAIRMLDVWFDTSTKTNEQVVPQLVDALVGYLRTCRCGGMPAETSDMIEAGAADFIRRRAGYIIAPVIEAMVAERTASLRAEGEARDRALKAKAEEQVAYWRKRQEAEKSPEDGISEDGETYTPIGDVAAWQGGYCNGRMSEADWWLKTLQHWPNEAARAATAREG